MNIFDKINRGDYTPKCPYTQKPIIKNWSPEKEIVETLKKHKDWTYKDAEEFTQRENIKTYNLQLKQYEDYIKEDNKLQEKLQNDLSEYCNFPRNHILYPVLQGIAYEKAHSGGWEEIASYFCGLVENFRDIIDNYNIIHKVNS